MDTITAIATANGTGGIGIVRISGDLSVVIADKIFRGTPVTSMKSHTMHLGKIVFNEQIIDEALICVFKAPNSFTGEDVVEIYCHGGILVCRLIIDAILSLGARLATPGEFTRRAFINGKLDLSQAEAVSDIISSQTKASVTVANNQLSGALSEKISNIRDALLFSATHLLAILDFSEEGVEDFPYEALKDKMQIAKAETEKLLSTADDGRIIKDGVNIAIVGAPNVGKSSLLNSISGDDRAIVTDIAGTTRDVLETTVNIRGCKVNLSDTAGIRKSDDIVEKIGVERSKKALEGADLTLLVIDGSRELGDEDEQVIELTVKKKTICLINKCDIEQKIFKLPQFLKTIKVSAKTGMGFEELFNTISDMYSRGNLTDSVIITNSRHKDCLVRADALLKDISNAMKNNVPGDIVLGDIELAIAALGEINGMTVSDEIIDNIFANFCVGK